MLKGLIGSFSMYSKIPMPQIQWNEDTRRYLLAFLPVVGIAVGLFYYLLFYAAGILRLGGIIQGALLTVIPLAVTGGIHLDGLADTADAINSYAPCRKKLEILKDPHVGAFGVIWLVGYLLLYFAFSTAVTAGAVKFICLSFVVSRALTALLCVSIAANKEDGSLAGLTRDTSTRAVKGIAWTGLGVCLIWYGVIHIWTALGVVWVLVCWFLGYRKYIRDEFGGISGDLAGFFLCITELILLIVVVTAQKGTVL